MFHSVPPPPVLFCRSWQAPELGSCRQLQQMCQLRCRIVCPFIHHHLCHLLSTSLMLINQSREKGRGRGSCTQLTMASPSAAALYELESKVRDGNNCVLQGIGGAHGRQTAWLTDCDCWQLCSPLSLFQCSQLASVIVVVVVVADCDWLCRVFTHSRWPHSQSSQLYDASRRRRTHRVVVAVL